MIPIPGINPHGLEDRTLTFHYIVNGDEQFTSTSINRHYCYAEFPKEIRDNYGTEWTTTLAEDSNQYSSLVKYKSKKVEDSADAYWGSESSGDLLMVYENKNLYAQVWYNYDVPEFANVIIIDTSGSMDGSDYKKVASTISSLLDDYICSPVSSAPDAKVYMYSGTFLKNLQSNILGTMGLIVDDNDTSVTYANVKKFVDSVPKQSSSEAMITCLYYAIADIQDKVLKGIYEKLSTESGRKLIGISFTLLTDESIFTSDTLEDVSNVNTKFPWFSSWQTTSNIKFTTTVKTSAETKRGFGKNIWDNLIHMSYFYGVNITWSMASKFRASSTDMTTMGDYSSIGVNYVQTSKNEYQEPEELVIPAYCKSSSPFDPMCKIVFNVPNSYALDSSTLLSYDDQFNLTTEQIKNKFHRNYSSASNVNSYCVFRYFNEDSITLPTLAQLGLASSPSIASLLSWVRDDGTRYSLGQTYVPSMGESNYSYITTFRLNIDSIIINWNSNGGSSVSSWTRDYNTTLGTLPTPTMAGNEFTGWYTALTGGTQVTSSTVVTGNATYYARWNATGIRDVHI